MKNKLFILGALVLVIGMLPLVIADGAMNSTGINVTVDTTSDCNEPVIYKDHTSRIWFPNDQTIYTASEYGTSMTNRHGYDGYEVPLRQNYVFAGETLQYFLIVEDANGAGDIDSVRLVMNTTDPEDMSNQVGFEVGACALVDEFTDVSHFVSDDGLTLTSYDDDTMASYVCTLVVQTQLSWNSLMDVGFTVYSNDDCDDPTLASYTNDQINSTQSDWLNFNPTLSVAIDGTILFGSVEPGTTALSNTIYVENAAEEDSGVVMDMYIASSDYFTDSRPVLGANSVCGLGNGIRYDQFGYYATKGSMNSGANNNLYPVLGESAVGLCVAEMDEFTPLPSHSGEISDMCHIINHDPMASLLNEGARMSMTFKLDVPENCEGEFTDGNFYILGRVV